MEFISSLLVGLAQLLCESMNMADRRRHKNDLKQAITDLEAANSELKALRDDLNIRIQQNELEGRSCSNHVREWLTAVQTAEAETVTIVATFRRREQRSRMLRRCLCCANYKLCKKAFVTLKRIGELRDRSNNIETNGRSIQVNCMEIPIKSVVGISVMMEQVLKFLSQENERGIIGVYGPGGVGKTTLLQSINNELITKGHQYDILILVTLSRESSECKIQQALGAGLGLSWDERETGEHRALKIYRALKQKRFLLLLDDVWEQIDFEKTGVPRPDRENKCKVMFTTRSVALCSHMGAECKLRVEFLEKQYAWELFCDKVGRDILESSSIRRRAEIIVSKCGGLPLALVTLGEVMANRETEEEWIHASEVLNRFPAEMKGMDYVFARLKLSYYNLDNDLLRTCFLYCALFPEEHSIEIEQLVEYWVGEGFITSSHGVNIIYKGYFLVGDLKAACLLETGYQKTQVKMHNVVRSFALWMASEQGTYKELILVEPSMGLTEAPKAESWRQALVISLLDNKIQTLPENPVCPNLTTLMLQQNNSLKKLPTGFFTYMPLLRVLNVSFTSITEIPESIKYLVELYYLAMSGTKISVLPQELGNLKKLKHLDLQRTQFLQKIPRDAICWLSKLEILNLYYSYAGWDLQSFGEDEVEELGFANLENLENLTSLGITILSLQTLKTLYEFSPLHKHIQHLHVENCNGLLYFNFSSLTNHGRNLRRLSIKSCHDLEYLVTPADVENDWLPSLEVLTLYNLHKLSRVWGNSVSQECLQNIRCISISHCHKLKNISWVPQLPKLEVIDLSHCREMEELISESESPSTEDPSLFPSLKTLTIRDLPELSSILPYRFSFLKLDTLVITNCPKVKKLPFHEKVQMNLPTVYCDEKWWDALEKGQPNIELCCLPRFVPN